MFLFAFGKVLLNSFDIMYVLIGVIFMFKNNKDEILYEVFKRYDSNFNKDTKTFKKAYKDIKSRYEEYYNLNNKNSKPNLESTIKDIETIKIERMRVENNIVEINSSPNSMLMGLIAVEISIGITLLPNMYNGIDKIIISGVLMIVFLIGIIVLCNTISKYGKHVKLYNVTLKVLDDIDMELKEKIEPLYAEEESVTVQNEEQSQKQVKPVSQQANGNWNITISAPSIIDTVESIYKIGKFAKKTFRKKK